MIDSLLHICRLRRCPAAVQLRSCAPCVRVAEDRSQSREQLIERLNTEVNISIQSAACQSERHGLANGPRCRHGGPFL
jgi:hypothetical protein